MRRRPVKSSGTGIGRGVGLYPNPSSPTINPAVGFGGSSRLSLSVICLAVSLGAGYGTRSTTSPRAGATHRRFRLSTSAGRPPTIESTTAGCHLPLGLGTATIHRRDEEESTNRKPWFTCRFTCSAATIPSVFPDPYRSRPGDGGRLAHGLDQAEVRLDRRSSPSRCRPRHQRASNTQPERASRADSPAAAPISHFHYTSLSSPPKHLSIQSTFSIYTTSLSTSPAAPHHPSPIQDTFACTRTACRFSSRSPPPPPRRTAFSTPHYHSMQHFLPFPASRTLGVSVI